MDNEKPNGLPPIPPFTAPLTNDFSRMPENPPRSAGHRRAQSEILVIPDDIGGARYGAVVGDGSGGDAGAEGTFTNEVEEDLISMYIDMDKAFPASSDGVGPLPGIMPPVRGRHQHSFSVDGFSMFNPQMFNNGGGGVSGSSSGGGISAAVEARKALSAAKLAELALTDPKRAKRMWANRLSAQRSKERKLKYMTELERKVQTLQTKATSLSAQLTLLQRDTKGLSAENSELKLRLQTAEQQVRLQDALNNALREETQRWKMLNSQAATSNNPNPAMMNFPASFGTNQLFFPNAPTMQNTLLTTQEFQQLQIQCQKRQQQQFQLQQFQQQQLQHQQQQGPSIPSSKENTTESKSSSS